MTKLVHLHPKASPDNRMAIPVGHILMVREHEAGTVVNFNIRHTAPDKDGNVVDSEPYWIRFTESFDEVCAKVEDALQN